MHTIFGQLYYLTPLSETLLLTTIEYVFMDNTKIRCQLYTYAQNLGIKDKLSDETE